MLYRGQERGLHFLKLSFSPLNLSISRQVDTDNKIFISPNAFKPQSTYIYRVPQCMPLVGVWTLPPPLSPESVPLPPVPKGGAHSPAGEGWGSPNSDAEKA
jgi:hypothetical protein